MYREPADVDNQVEIQSLPLRIRAFELLKTVATQKWSMKTRFQSVVFFGAGSITALSLISSWPVTTSAWCGLLGILVGVFVTTKLIILFVDMINV